MVGLMGQANSRAVSFGKNIENDESAEQEGDDHQG
jgi:hypothetical protein